MSVIHRRIERVDQPYKLSSYMKLEWKSLVCITISGLICNAGLIAAPYYEGQLAQYLYDILNVSRPVADMFQLAVIYFVVIAVVQGARAIKRYFVRLFANATSRNMRHMLYNSLVHMKSSSLQEEGLGSIMTKAISDVDACVEGMRKFLTELFDTGIALVAYAVMLFSYDWRLALISCVFTPFAYILANALKKKIAVASAAYKESNAKLNQRTMDRITNAITYRVYGNEARQDERYEERLQDYETKAVAANIYETVMTPLYNVISMTGTILIVYFGAKNVLGTGWTMWDIAAFTAFLAAFTKLSSKSSHAAKLFNAIQKAQVSWARIQPLLKDYQEDNQTSSIDLHAPASLLMNEVSIAWPNGTVVLSDINLEAKPGEWIGITGEVASGKSALGKIFIQESEYQGSVQIGGHELSSLNSYERSQMITYMGHEPQLMSDTVQDNITLGDSMDIQPYLHMASLDEEVQEMKEHENTFVGAGGIRLSGGQQDRLALARSLAHAGKLLILDDPFSAVDRKSEDRIMERMKPLCEDKIVLLMSHRLRHFPECSQVIFLENGKAIVSTHAQLMKDHPVYRNLYTKQMSGGDLDAES